MADYELDDVDRQLLELLQENPRYSAIDLAAAIGVSDNTIHNRMDRLEAAGVITDFSATIDHARIGLDLYFHFACTVRISDRADVADQASEIPAVIEVMELMTGQQNLLIKAVGETNDDITHVAQQLDDLALEIDDENLIRTERRLPLQLMETVNRPG